MRELRDIKIDPAKLRKARQSAYPDSSLTKVAQLLGIQKQSLSDYETGASLPNADRLAQLCLLYGVSVADLTDADSFDIKNLRNASATT